MTCDEFKERAAAFALVALDDGERDACARHLASALPHLGCREAAAEAELVAAHLGAALAPERPAPHVWREIADRLYAARGGAVEAHAGIHEGIDEGTRRRSLYHLCGWLVAAALVGLYLYNTPLDHRLLQMLSTHGGHLVAGH